MKKFLVLLQKEVRELITLQTILPMVIVASIFFVMGRVISSAQKSAASAQSVGVIDLDHTAASASVGSVLEQAKFTVRNYDDNLDAAISDTEARHGTAVLVIPQGFAAGIGTKDAAPIQTYTVLRNFSVTGSIGGAVVQSALSALNDSFSSQLIASRAGGNPATLKNPVTTVSYVQIGDRRAQADPNALITFVQQQITFIPIVLFIIILMAAQIIATTIATEKENKTLETLLSLPVSRSAVIMAKMLAAAIIAAIGSAAYMFGYHYYSQGITGTLDSGSAHAVAAQLGLVLTPANYVVLGVVLFFAILAALAIALILGAFAEDVKSVQSLITPLMVLIMIPYLMTLLLDVSSVSAPVRWLVYAIPFSHAFLAAPNLFLHHYAAIAWGVGYEALTFLIFLALALRIFSTDRIVTMKLNWSRRRS